MSFRVDSANGESHSVFTQRVYPYASIRVNSFCGDSAIGEFLQGFQILIRIAQHADDIAVRLRMRGHCPNASITGNVILLRLNQRRMTFFLC